MLYELFSINDASLRLYVDLCAGSPYLSGILMNNPGMIDELLDSLLIDQARGLDELTAELSELLRGATDPDPILHSFQDKELLRIGVRDLLGRDDIRATTAALSDLAEAILGRVVELAARDVRDRRAGTTGGPANGHLPPNFAVVALGKFGGRELGYHSDLDLIVWHDPGGDAAHARRPAAGGPEWSAADVTNLVQRVIVRLGTTGASGRLYTADMRLRPTGKSGSLTVSVPEFERYYASGGGEAWEILALTKARIVVGYGPYSERVYRSIEAVIRSAPRDDMIAQVRLMRARIEKTAGPNDLKRGYGGLADLEFIVQLLVVRYPELMSPVRATNFWDTSTNLAARDRISVSEREMMQASYSFVRRVEARVRLMTDRATSQLPEAAHDREKLARASGIRMDTMEAEAAAFDKALAGTFRKCRSLFDDVLRRESALDCTGQ